MVQLTLPEVRDLAIAALTRNGCDAANAEAVADIMTIAERDGCASHGVFRLPGYCASLKSGKVDGTAHPTIERIAPGVLRVDSKGGFSPLGIERGRAPLIELAREQGIAAMTLCDTYHFAALWPEVEPLAEAGLVALAMTQATPIVAPHGGRQPFFGTNPISFAYPRADGPPVVFDQASATMAKGDVMIHARDGHPVPPGTGIDKHGEATTDPAEILDGGAQLAFGGYKGSAIAMMVELLAAGLIGQAFSYEAGRQPKDGGPSVGGELILAMDPEKFGAGADWRARSEAFFAEMTSQPGVRLPGDSRRSRRERVAREGATIPDALHAKIVELTKG